MVPGAKLIPTSAVHRVTLVLGADGKQVTGLTTRGHASPRSRAPSPKPRESGIPCIN